MKRYIQLFGLLILAQFTHAQSDSIAINEFLKNGCFVREMADQISLNKYNETTSYYFRFDTIRPDGYGMISMSERYKSSLTTELIASREKVFGNKEVYHYLIKILYDKKRLLVFTGDEAYNMKKLFKGNLGEFVREQSYKLSEGAFMNEYNGFSIDLKNKTLTHNFIKYKESADNFYEYSYVMYYNPYPKTENEKRELLAKNYSQKVVESQMQEQSNDVFIGENPTLMATHSDGWIYVAEIEKITGAELTKYVASVNDITNAKKPPLEDYLKGFKQSGVANAGTLIETGNIEITMNVDCNLRATQPIKGKSKFVKGNILGTTKANTPLRLLAISYIPASNGNYYLWAKVMR
ncbi:MAG: hypothetical protein NTX03_13015 [Bacteroidetes bacterium]|nr:hypothetical protein [Bacteroidota bacterium]